MTGLQERVHTAASLALAVAIYASLTSCRSAEARSEPSIEFTRVPTAADGGPDNVEAIEGRVRGARPGQQVVLYALSGAWWVQPSGPHPFTEVQKDSTWKSTSHLGVVYAALLVEPGYRPPYKIDALPEKGGLVLAVAAVRGTEPASPPKMVDFSGYQWEVLHAPERENIRVDDRGFLHLQLIKERGKWMTAEVKLSRSLGYGTYKFVVSDVEHLEPDAVLALFTYDLFGPSHEIDIEISRWGEPEDKNAQYVIQPYIVPANTVRFAAPSGRLTFLMDWQPGRASFKTIRGASDLVEEHVFTSGVPPAGTEQVRINLYAYGGRIKMQQETEVIVEKFEFLP